MVAINLLVALTGVDLVAQYITRNSAPRLVYAAKLAGTLRRNRIDNMFRSSETFHKAQPNEYDCLIVDEAHRLKEKSGMFGNLGENQVKELINAAKLSVFFIDEDQKVTRPRRWAKKHAALVTELKLESQFRCNGSDGYLAWLDYALGIAKTANTANTVLDPRDYDFRVLDDPAQLHALIRRKNTNNKARMAAGYCRPWLSKKDHKRPTCQGLELAESTYHTLMTRGHNPNPALRRIPREAGGGASAMRARPDGVRPGFRARHNYASRPGCKAGGDFSAKIAEAGSRKTAMRFMCDYATRRAPAMRAENFIRSFLAKKYTSKKKYAPDGAWQHEEIILQPLNPAYSPIVIPNAEDEEFMVVAEVVGVCRGSK